MEQNYILKLKSKIRDILLEEFSGEENFAQKALNDIKVLSHKDNTPYKFVGETINDGSKIWKFHFETNNKEYLSDFYIIQYQDGKWACKMVNSWKEKSKDYTANKGKDSDVFLGKFDTYEKMVEEANNKLDNNLLYAPIVFKDNDFEYEMDTEIVNQIKKYQQEFQDIQSLDKEKFADVIDFYNQIKNFKTEDEIRKFLGEKYSMDMDKQNVIYMLEKLEQVDFHKGKQKMLGV